MSTPFCGPELLDKYEKAFFSMGMCAIHRRCFYKYDSYDLTIDYAKKFWETYKGENKFFKIDFLDAHEQTGNNVKTIDMAMRDLLEYLVTSEEGKFTDILIHTDHGKPMAYLNIFE